MIVRTEGELAYVIDQMRDKPIIAFDTETYEYGYPYTYLVGMSFAWGNKRNEGCYIPVGHMVGSQLPIDMVLEEVKQILEDPEKLIVMHNATYDMKVATLYGIEIGEKIWDTMIASWLMNSDSEHGLKDLAWILFKHKMTELSDICETRKHPVFENKKVYLVHEVPIDRLGDYAWDDAVQTFKLYEHYRPLIDEEYKKLFYELEMEYLHTLCEMEMWGCYVNKEDLLKLGEELGTALREYEEAVYNARPSKEKFNLNSTKQLNQVLFQELKLKPVGAQGKTGNYSVDKEVMKKFAAQGVEICARILDYRQLVKLKGTYVDGMSKIITGPDTEMQRLIPDWHLFLKPNPDTGELAAPMGFGGYGRIHTSLNRHGTRTGRLSSSNPNLQNIPKNKKYDIRHAFQFAPKDLSNNGHEKRLAIADFSQIEYRAAAHVAKCPVMSQMFWDGIDFHSRTAPGCWHLDCEVTEVKDKFPEYRDKAKSVNFGGQIASEVA